MRLSITELLGKTRQDLYLEFSEADNTSIPKERITFSGDNAWQEFEDYYQQNKPRFNTTTKVNVYNKFHDIPYVTKFPNMTKLWIHGSGQQLRFPDMRELNHLEEIHINGQGKPSSYENLDTTHNLQRLYIGDWSIATQVKVASFDVIFKCRKLSKLYLSHFKVINGSVRELVGLAAL